MSLSTPPPPPPLRSSSNDNALPPAPIVAVRCRPQNQEQQNCITTESGQVNVGVLPFSFDHAFDSESSQQEVYKAIGEPLIAKAFSGFNSTLLAYGQTGSGKSYSMSGTVADPGVIPRLVDDVFERATLESAAGTIVSISISMLEIHNEQLGDLLEPKATSKLDVREEAALGVHVHGLCSVPVHSAAEVHALLQKGIAARAVASTGMNAVSSRSHMVVGLRVVQSTALGMDVTRRVSATINLVDLAGSERASKSGAAGELLKEGGSINKSLSALGMVVNALAKQNRAAKRQLLQRPAGDGTAKVRRPAGDGKADVATAVSVHVPYRDSKLTRVLQDSLGGNSITVMLATIAAAASEREETLATLHFAERAKAITLKARRNELTTASAAAAAAASAAKARPKAVERFTRVPTPATAGARARHSERCAGSAGEATFPMAIEHRGTAPPAAASRRVADDSSTRCFRNLRALEDNLGTVRRDFWTGGIKGMEWDDESAGEDEAAGDVEVSALVSVEEELEGDEVEDLV